MRTVTNLQKTLFVMFIFSIVSGLSAYSMQAKANSVVSSCSYLDPITVDIVALGVGLFFLIEGLVDALKHKESVLKRQLTRCIRVSLGASILTIHIMQFMHK